MWAKRWLAKQLARVLGVEFDRFGMSTNTWKTPRCRGSLSAPPGCGWCDQGGLLRSSPDATTVLVLGEDRKRSHPDILQRAAPAVMDRTDADR